MRKAKLDPKIKSWWDELKTSEATKYKNKIHPLLTLRMFQDKKGSIEKAYNIYLNEKV